MPGIILNPIANFGFGQGNQPDRPYVPIYNHVYAASYNTYEYNDTILSSETFFDGGLVRFDFDGSIDSTWSTTVNANPTTEIKFAQGARDYVLADERVRVAAQPDDKRFTLFEKSTGNIFLSSQITDAGGNILGMSTDTQEKNIYFYGQQDMASSGSFSSPSGLGRVPHSSITPDVDFNTNVGNGPKGNTSGGALAFISDVHVNPNGKIGVCHNGQTWDNQVDKYCNFVVLNEDGTVDTTFDFGDSTFRVGTNLSGYVNTSHWIPSGSSGIWVVAGDFDRFGTSTEQTDYNRIMAFNEDGSINQQFTDNLKAGLGVNTINGDIYDIIFAQNDYYFYVGDFTIPNNNLLALSGLGEPQAGLNSISNGIIRKGIAHDFGPPDGNKVYINYENDTYTDNQGVVTNIQSIAAIDPFNFQATSAFAPSKGLQSRGEGFANPGSLFKG